MLQPICFPPRRIPALNSFLSPARLRAPRVLIALLLAAAPGHAQTIVQDTSEGQALFARHCAVCHGAAATGDGPMASVLLIQPVDLTRLAAENGGIFPTARVAARIDGRDPLVSHGSPMPVYGPYFEGEDAIIKLETGQPLHTSAPVVALVDWLKTRQSE